MIYLEWLFPTEFPKIMSFLEKNWKSRKTAGQTVERIAGRYANAILWNCWVGSQTAWRLSRGPGACTPAQPSGVSGWLQMAAIPVCNGLSSDGKWPLSWLPFGDYLIFSVCFLNLTCWILLCNGIWLLFTVSILYGSMPTSSCLETLLIIAVSSFTGFKFYSALQPAYSLALLKSTLRSFYPDIIFWNHIVSGLAKSLKIYSSIPVWSHWTI